MTTWLSWRWIFLVNLPIGVVAVVLALTRVSESRSTHARRPDWAGFVLFTAALSSLVYGLIESSQRSFGDALVLGCLIANWQRLPPQAASRLGVVTGGRIGGAVVRNRARRLLRETFRLHQHDLAGPVDLVLVARPSIAGKGLAEVERDLLTTLRKAGLLR